MALDPVFITRAIEAMPFPSAPNVVVSYPHREDWWNRYRALRSAGGRKHNINDFEWLYQDSKRSYQEGMFKRLKHLKRSATGRAVLAELRAWLSYSVCIFPFEFLPSVDEDSRNSYGVTDMVLIPQTQRERARGIGPLGTKLRKRGVYAASFDKPGAVDVYYSDYLCDYESDADGVLLHELVHAMRIISGHGHATRMRGSYKNSEEFYANTIEGIFRSERGQRVYDYAWRPTNQASVLRQPMARALITALCHQQMSLCIALARVDARFNPIRAIADKLWTIDL